MSTSIEFLRQFREGNIRPEAFGHEEHLRLAHIHLQDVPINEGIRSFRKDLKMFVDRAGQVSKYHETITVALLLVVRERMEALGPDPSWTEFAGANPDLFSSALDVLYQYYEPETLHSDAARESFVWPDRSPFKTDLSLIF